MASKPIINFRLQDAINPDPVLGNPAFCWRVSNQREFATVLERMRTMTEGEFSAGRNKAIDFVRDYFHPLRQTAFVSSWMRAPRLKTASNQS
jgi:hypothetical protein